MNLRLGSPLLALMVWGIGNGFAWAQTIIATPSLTISEEYDDNIRLTSKNPQSDFISAARPALRLQVKDPPWYVTLAGSLRGELFANHSELNNFDNQEGSASIEFRPERPFSLSLTDTFTRSTNPATVAPEAGIATGRVPATPRPTLPIHPPPRRPPPVLLPDPPLRFVRCQGQRHPRGDGGAPAPIHPETLGGHELYLHPLP